MPVDQRVMDALNNLTPFDPKTYSYDGMYITLSSDGKSLFFRRNTNTYVIEKHPTTGTWWSTEPDEKAKRGFYKRIRSQSEEKVLEIWLKEYLQGLGIEYTDSMAGSEARSWWPYPSKPLIVAPSPPIETTDWFQQMKKQKLLTQANEMLDKMLGE